MPKWFILSYVEVMYTCLTSSGLYSFVKGIFNIFIEKRVNYLELSETFSKKKKLEQIIGEEIF